MKTIQLNNTYKNKRFANIALLLLPVIFLMTTSNGFYVNNIFLVLIISLNVFLSLHKKGTKLTSKIIWSTFFFVLYSLLHFESIGSRDYISMLFIITILFCIDNDQYIFVNSSFYKCGSVVFIITTLTLVGYLANNLFMNFEGRFQAWSQSPTTIGIYCLYFTLLFHSFVSKKKSRLLIVSILLMLVALFSGTRSVLLLAVFFIFCFWFPSLEIKLNKKNITILIILFILTLSVFNDIIYNFLSELGLNILTDRYAGGTDDSYLTRLSLKTEQLAILTKSNVFNLLFGHGNGYTISAINFSNVRDSYVMLPHNDFLKLLIDWGIIFTFAFLLLIINLFLQIKRPLAPLMLYVLSFSHNMMFDHFSLILLFSLYYISNKNDK